MADEQGVEETITTHQKSAIDEYDLDLSLGLRPSLNSSSSSSSRYPKNLPESNGHQIMSKLDQQAIRRHEAKVKRDLKRKASYSFSSFPNGVVIQEEGDEDGVSERRRKGMHNVGFQPPSLWGNAGVFRQGQNCKTDKIMNEGGENGEFRSSVSSGSSSGISDNNHYHSNSAAGGNSSDTSSHSSHSHLHGTAANVPTVRSTAKSPVSSQQQTHINCSNHNLLQPQLGSSSPNQRDSFPNSSPHSKSPEHITSAHTIPQATDMCTSDKESTPKPRSPNPKEAKVVLGKPPKPNNGQISQQSAVLPQMPCVSATGNGPNGKTITGFLYKYTKTEVSIICVCHGASFSPASFVEHAGGVDVEHPLKHIRVVPFAVS